MIFRPAGASDLARVTPLLTGDPASALTADQFRRRLQNGEYRAEWTWIAEEAGEEDISNPPVAVAIWGGRPQDSLPSALARDPVGAQVLGHLLGELVRPALDDLVERVSVRTVEHPGEIHDQAASCLDHRRRGDPGCVCGCPQATGEHEIPVPPLDLPERKRRIGPDLVSAPRVVDQQVQALLLRPDPAEYGVHLGIVS